MNFVVINIIFLKKIGTNKKFLTSKWHFTAIDFESISWILSSQAHNLWAINDELIQLFHLSLSYNGIYRNNATRIGWG